MNAGGHFTPDERLAWDLIPWLAAGTASETERAFVEQHVAVCADCAAELVHQQAVQSAVAATVAVPPVDVEAGLRRMMERIDVASGALPMAGKTSDPPANTAARWLAVACAVAVVQTAAIAVLLGRAADPAPPAVYATLSDTPASRATLRLVPSPEMSLQALRTLLARLDLRIVDTSADGTFFGLVPRRAGAGRDAAALAALRAAPGVLLAEPIAAPGVPPGPGRP